MQRIGILGVGHFGKYHLMALREIPGFKLMGFFDTDREKSVLVEKEFGVKSYPSYEALLEDVDVVDIVVPTVDHFNCAVSAIRKQKHIFLEKPVTHTLQDAETLLKLADEAAIKVQVGHIERFNPAFLAARSSIQNPMFIEIHRLQQFSVRSTDVCVILNLMIHDIDIVLSTVKSNLKKISASGVAVVTGSSDIANARLEFDNGCVANISASRISLNNLRRARFFQKDTYVSVDFLSKQTDLVRLMDMDGSPDPEAFVIEPGEGLPPRQILASRLPVKPNNAIKEELISFLQAIENNSTPPVTLEDGYRALLVANQIKEKIRQQNDI